MMPVVERVIGLPARICGDQRRGWGPAGAATPLSTPIREVLLDIEIQFDGIGYLLCCVSRDRDVYGDTWHESREEAEQAAAEGFGVQPHQWQLA
jgi:hypothetical protein